MQAAGEAGGARQVVLELRGVRHGRAALAGVRERACDEVRVARLVVQAKHHRRADVELVALPLKLACTGVRLGGGPGGSGGAAGL